MGLGTGMDGANLPVYLFEVNGADPVFYLYFQAEMGNIDKIFYSVIDKVK